MNQRLWSGLIATLVTTALSTTSSTHAEQPRAVEQTTEANHLTASQPTNQENSQALDLVKVGSPSPIVSNFAPQNDANAIGSPISTFQANVPSPDVVKVGEYQSRLGRDINASTIAKIQPHQLAGREAATLYVRDIPVITFLGSPSTNANTIKEGITEDSKKTASGADVQQQANLTSDPVWQATEIAARLNQLSRDNIDAKTITVIWNPQNNSFGNQERQNTARVRSQRESYIIKVDDEQLVEINTNTKLPDTTNNLAQDALQVTNRLRRLMGNAEPLRDIAGRPAPQPVRIAFSRSPQVVSRVRGTASWYGPGFHGNRSANGEIFNQNALTAAHRSLPFGTRVKVTNLNNGLSVVVRINDRGPYSGGRIIDLSAGAARIIGIVNTGVAPVNLEVLGKPETVAIEQN